MNEHSNGSAADAVAEHIDAIANTVPTPLIPPPESAPEAPAVPQEPAFLSLAYFDKAISEGEALARQLYGIYAGTDAFQQWQQVVAQLNLLRSQRQQLVDGS